MSYEALIWIAAGICGMGAGIGFFAQNSLLRLLAADAPDIWASAGRPSGLFSPPRGSFLNQGIPFGWLVRPPERVLENEAMRAQLFRIRVGYILLIIGVCVGLAAATYGFVSMQRAARPNPAVRTASGRNQNPKRQ
jgi:hypothetical protein